MHVTDRFNSIQKSEIPFTLPRAYLDPEGNLHHEGGRGHVTCRGIRRNRAHEGAPSRTIRDALVVILFSDQMWLEPDLLPTLGGGSLCRIASQLTRAGLSPS